MRARDGKPIYSKPDAEPAWAKLVALCKAAIMSVQGVRNRALRRHGHRETDQHGQVPLSSSIVDGARHSVGEITELLSRGSIR